MDLEAVPGRVPLPPPTPPHTHSHTQAKSVLLVCVTAHIGFSARSVVPENYKITEGSCCLLKIV